MLPNPSWTECPSSDGTAKTVNQLLLTVYHEELQGIKLTNIRNMITLTATVSLHIDIKKQYGVRLLK